MSLTRQMLSGTMESTMVDVSGYNFNASMTSEYLDSATESLISDIYNADKAFMVADVIGECRVLTESADPEVLLENIVTDAIEKLKEGFRKFLAKIKAWFAKVKKFFEVLFMKGKDLVKKYGKEIGLKSKKGFKYKGFEYKISEGDALVDSISKGVADEIDRLTGGMENLKDMTTSDREAAIKMRTRKEENKWENGTAPSKGFEAKIVSTVSDVTSDTSTTDYQDKLVSKLCSGASDASELAEQINEKYRNGDTEKTEIDEFEANSPDEMCEFISKFDKAIRDMNKEERNFENDVKVVIKSLDKVSSMKDNKDIVGKSGKKQGSTETTYKLASKISAFVSSALAVRKKACDTKVSVYKEINSSWTSVLKAFVLKKEVKESAFFDDFDSMIALTESADAETETDDTTVDSAEEGKCGAKESYNGTSLLEAAYNFL